VRVRTNVAAVPKLFDYSVPEKWAADVRVGTLVRIALHGRRVGGWVVEDDVTPEGGLTIQPLAHVTGYGPPPCVLPLAEWAAWRWAGPASFFLGVASAPMVVRGLPSAPPLAPVERPTNSLSTLVSKHLRSGGTSLLRIPPATDLLDAVLTVASEVHESGRSGSVLVLVPSVGWAERLTGRLNRRGVSATTAWTQARAGWPVVVGSRAAAWAPVPELAAALVLDAHDAAYVEESAPTYNAVEVVMERSARAGAPCLVVSPVPTSVLRAELGRSGQPEGRLSTFEERFGWSALQCVDRRDADPRSGLFSEEFVQLARRVIDDPEALAQRGPLVCVYNRTGGARLLACAHCGAVAQCTRCSAAVRKVDDRLLCPRCAEERPLVCAACGKIRLKILRAGVTRLREELAALLGAEVDEVAGPAPGDGAPPNTPVLIGTEAVLHRVRRASAVAFLDIDLHLLAPRVSATEETLAFLVRASRLVGPRSGEGSARVLAQTRVPNHAVLRAAVLGDPAALDGEEDAMREGAGLPPFSAVALVSGVLSAQYLADLAAVVDSAGVEIIPLAEDSSLVRAPDHTVLCDLLSSVARPPGRGLRIAVDPSSV
jgi:primosomal protein N' (replication factor Y)